MAELREKQKEEMVDPSFNVSTLVALQSKRQDDLRLAHEKSGDEQNRHLKEILQLSNEHQKELRITETGRLDSIRQVDMVNASNTAASLALAIQTLNTTSITNADNLRNSLTATAAAMAKSTSDLATTIATQQSIRDENINKRLTSLEQSSYVGIGKEKVSDPLLAGYMADIKELLSKGATRTGIGIGMKDLWGYVLGAIGLVILLLNAFKVI